MKRSLLSSLFALGLPVLAACNQYATSPAHIPNNVEALSTESALVYPTSDRQSLVFVEPGATEMTTREILIGSDKEEIEWMIPSLDQKHVLALTGPTSIKQETIIEKLYRIPANGEGEIVEYEVNARFNSVAFTPDHKRAILYFSDSTSDVIQNANQVAIIDLNSDAVTSMTLNGFGNKLTDIHFPAQIKDGKAGQTVKIGSKNRDIAAFLAQDEVILVDMADRTANQVAVPLGETSGAIPEGTLLRPGNKIFDEANLFVRSAGSSDIAMLTLRPKSGGGFTAMPSLLDVGRGVQDFVFFDDGEIPYLISVSGNSGSLVFTDIRTQESFPIKLGSDVGRIALRQSNAGTQALVWQNNGQSVYTLELDGIADAVGRTPTKYGLDGSIDDLNVLDNNRLLVGSGNQLYLLDLGRDQITPFDIKVAYNADDAVLLDERLLLAADGEPWILSVDLNNFDPKAMALDASVSSFHYMPGIDKVVAVHPDKAGFATVVDANKLSRSNAYSEWGFLVEDVIDAIEFESEESYLTESDEY